jgi:hypothetical protein
MKRIVIIALAVLVAVCATAQAQDLKPVKDKNTKLFGYQDKDKNWVIEPAYTAAKRFKEGLAEVTIKPGKTKFHGIIDETGRTIIPTECTSVSVNYKERLIMAERPARFGDFFLWGVYDFEGNELFEPYFISGPWFYNGKGVAKSGETGFKGVIDTQGNVLIPFENLAITQEYGGYAVLTSQFERCTYDSRMNKASVFPYPGYVAPYDPKGDLIRAAAWHVGPIGYRFHRNSLKEARLTQDARGRIAVCSDLRIDWGYNRFVRFEPDVDAGGHPGSLQDPESGRLYTIKAFLCEADGSPVSEISSWGWIEGTANEGIIYNAEGRETWMLMHDLNAPAIPSFTSPLTFYRHADMTSIYSELGLHAYDVERLYEPYRAANRFEEIVQGENAGITAAMPRPAPDLRTARTIEQAMRAPIFQAPFTVGQVVNCNVKHKGGEVEIELFDKLVCHFEDRFEDPYYSFNGDSEIFWGPNNARAVWLSLECVRKDPKCIHDDVTGSELDFVMVIGLYEEDGSFLQALGVVPAPDYYTNGVLVFEPLGIAILVDTPAQNPALGKGRDKQGFVTTDESRLPLNLSALHQIHYPRADKSRSPGYRRGR